VPIQSTIHEINGPHPIHFQDAIGHLFGEIGKLVFPKALEMESRRTRRFSPTSVFPENAFSSDKAHNASTGYNNSHPEMLSRRYEIRLLMIRSYNGAAKTSKRSTGPAP